jgi:hypothetical protein
VRVENCQVENQFTLQSADPHCLSFRPFRSVLRNLLPASTSRRLAGFLVGTALCRSAPLEFRQPVGSGPATLGFWYPAKASKTVHFLRGLEEENLTSPFFGIFLLKRLT